MFTFPVRACRHVLRSQQRKYRKSTSGVVLRGLSIESRTRSSQLVINLPAAVRSFTTAAEGPQACGGCGATLQSNCEDSIGFIAHRDDNSANLCQRCFRISHYGDYVAAPVSISELEAQLKSVAGPDHFMVVVVDIIDLHGSLPKQLIELVARTHSLVVVNKIDTLPKHTNFRRLENYVRHELRAAGLANTHDVCLVSAARGFGVEKAWQKVRKFRKGRPVVTIGAANVGKSTFVNQLSRAAHGIPLDGDRRHRRKRDKKPYAVFLDALPPGMSVGDVVADMNALKGYEAGSVEVNEDGLLSSDDEAGGDGKGSDSEDSDEDGQLHAPSRHPHASMSLDPLAMGGLGRQMGRSPVPRERVANPVTMSAAGRAGAVHGAIRVAGHTPQAAGMLGASGSAKQGPEALQGIGMRVEQSGTRTQAGGSVLSGTVGAPLIGTVGGGSDASAPSRLRPATVSPLPGTTLGLVTSPLPGGMELIDTPGLISNESRQALMEYLAASHPKELDHIIPHKRLKPLTSRLRPGRSIFLGGLIRVDYQDPTDSHHMLLTWFGGLKPHITTTDRAEELFDRHRRGTLLSPLRGDLHPITSYPLAEAVEAYDPQGGVESHAQGGDSKRRTRQRRAERSREAVLDLVFPGLGWLSITPVDIRGHAGWQRAIDAATFSVYAASGIECQLRAPMLPFEASGTSRSDWKE